MIRAYNLKNSDGLSILELICVLGILTILIVIAIPNFSQGLIPKMRLKSACQIILTDLMNIRICAATANLEYRVVFTVGSESYQIEKGNLSNGSTIWTVEGNVRSLADSSNSYYHSGIDILSVSPTPIVIKPSGTMTSTTITVQNQGGDSHTITSSIAGCIKLTL